MKALPRLKNIVWLLFVVSTLSLLTGCGSSNMVNDVQPSDLQQHSLVLGSVTESTTQTGSDNMDAAIRLTSAGGTVNKTFSPQLNSTNSVEDPVAKQQGIFFAALLPAGQYLLNQVNGKPYSVTIASGKIIYIGNFNLSSTAQGRHYRVTNQSQRDLRLFKALYPDLNWRQDLLIQLAK